MTKKKKSLLEFKGEVLEGSEEYRICGERNKGLTDLNGILKRFLGKKVRITIEEI